MTPSTEETGFETSHAADARPRGAAAPARPPGESDQAARVVRWPRLDTARRALGVGVLGVALAWVSRPPVREPDELVTLATAESWLAADASLRYAPREAAPSSRWADRDVYRDGDALRPVATPALAALALPLVALGHLAASAPLELTEGEPAPARDPRVVLFGAIAPLAFGVLLALFVMTGRGLEARAWAVALATLGVAIPLLAFGAGHPRAMIVATLVMVALQAAVARESRAGAHGRRVPYALGLAVAIDPVALFAALPVAVAFYRNERSWRRPPSRLMARVVVSIALGLSLLAIGAPPRSSGAWNPLYRLGDELGAWLPLGLVAAPVLVLAAVGAVRLARRSASLGWIAAGVPLAAAAIAIGLRAPGPEHALIAIGPLGASCLVGLSARGAAGQNA